jgi:predicted aspartyl protease
MRRIDLLWLLLAIGLAAPTSVAKAEGGFEVVQTVMTNQLHLFAPVSVNGSKIIWFGVDTGAPVSLISPALRHALSLPTTNSADLGFGTVRTSKTQLAFAQSVKSMAMELGPGYFAEAPVASVLRVDRTREARIPFDKEGIIGMNFLLKHGAVINCRTQQIFFSRNRAKLPLTRQGYEKWGFTYVPIRITSHGYVEAEGTVAGATYSFIVDTGAPLTVLEPSILKRTRARYYYNGVGVIGPYAGIKARIMFAKTPGLKFETQDMSNVVLGFAETGNHNFGVAQEYGGLIGADLLWKRHAIIDLGNRGLFLMAGDGRRNQ